MAVLVLEEIMKLADGGLSNLILQMLRADDAAFILVSPAGNIITQTPGARRLLRQAPLRPAGEALSERAAKAVRFVLETGGESALDEEIDGHLYRLEIRPVDEGALLYFASAEGQAPVMPLTMYGQIVSSLSHILALLYLIPGADAGRQEHLLDNVRRDSLRIYRSLSHLQLLEYADDPERILHWKEHDLAAHCRALCEKCRMAVRQRGNAVVISCDAPEHCNLVYDEALMTRAVLELLVNALRAPGVTRVRLQMRRTGNHASILVSDNGSGVPPEELDRLYHAWQRAQDVDDLLEKQARGLPYGLGLPLVRRIAGWHSGTLLLENAGPGGTVFRLTIPADLPADQVSLGQPFPEDGLDLAELELSVL